MARSIECRCDPSFTCNYCLRIAPPWHWTFSTSSFSPQPPLSGQGVPMLNPDIDPLASSLDQSADGCPMNDDIDEYMDEEEDEKEDNLDDNTDFEHGDPTPPAYQFNPNNPRDTNDD